MNYLVDVSDIFYFFFSGGGEGGVRVARKGVGFIENPRRGVSSRRGGGRGTGRVSAGEFGGGGGDSYFFRGPNSYQD